eukprot:2301144-Lingulodinium_polyedra.AAC.1
MVSSVVREDTIEAFKFFVGPREKGVFKLYSDLGKELVATAKEYHSLHQHCQPGIHKSNVVIERANRE